MAGKYHVRSISLPATSHPTSIRVEQELNSLKLQQFSSTNTAKAVCSGLSGMGQLCSCVDELLAMQKAEAVLLSQKSKQWVANLFDASMKILDACSTSRDAVFEVKRHVQEVQSALRRRKGDSSIERSISSYRSFRKSMKKDAAKNISVLKKIDMKIRASALNTLDIDCSRLIKVLTESTTMAISIFESVLLFLGAPLSSRRKTKWSLVPRLTMNKGVGACDNEIANEFKSADAAITKWASGEVNLDAPERLETLETSLGSLEDCLENMFRCLIRSRVSLLNIMSN